MPSAPPITSAQRASVEATLLRLLKARNPDGPSASSGRIDAKMPTTIAPRKPNRMMPEDDRRPFFTPKTLAAYFSVSERTVRQMLADGVIPSFKISGQRRILASDVDAHVAKQRDASINRGGS
jgi:excisionase family DNA binding protein